MLKPVLQPQKPPQRTVLTVSQLNAKAKAILESGLSSVWLSGELSNLTRASSGHWYFTLKDDGAQISCAMFRFKTQNLRFAPKEGDKIVVKGKVSLYEARGNYQLIADYMEPAGLGDLQQKLNQLMQKLSSEGLFDANRKRAIPSLPKRIGVVTSPTGAAIHDVLTVLKRRCPMIPVVVYPTQVQGLTAVQHIIKAIDQAEQRGEVDVLLVTRGGGSLEDLWSFNDERLARRIVKCDLPVVAAVGHEIDTTVAELVADLRAPTPSAAAELMVPDQQALQQKLDILSLTLEQSLTKKIEGFQTRLAMASAHLAEPESTILASQIKLDRFKGRLQQSQQNNLREKTNALEKLDNQLKLASPLHKLKVNGQKLKQLEIKLNNEWKNRFSTWDHRLKILVGRLNTLSPLSTLSRGYSIARVPENGQVISSIKKLSSQQKFTLIVSDGEASCQVESVRPKLDED